MQAGPALGAGRREADALAGGSRCRTQSCWGRYRLPCVRSAVFDFPSAHLWSILEAPLGGPKWG
jgi:hypothetical protein